MIRSNLVRLRDNRMLCFYYQVDKGILYRVYENGKWGREIRLIDNGRENFTVNIDNNGLVYIFCQDLMGDIILCAGKPGEGNDWSNRDNWNKKVMLKNQQNRIRVVQLNTIFSDEGLCLIYNVPHADNYIVRQILGENGIWSPAEHIDKFVSFSDCLFHMHRISKEHYILYYMNKSGEYNLGYREITPSHHSPFISFHTTGYIISDCSFLTTHEGIHTLYVVKSMFSSQLIYRRKESDSFNNPIVLAEAQKIDNCLLFFAEERLYATYMINSQLFFCVSADSGVTFSRPARYKNKFCLGPIRAVYISEPEQSISDFFCRQVYVDGENPWDAQLLPDLCDSFYPAAMPPSMPVPVTPVPQKTDHVNPEPAISGEQYAQVMDELNDLNAEVIRLKNQLIMNEEYLADKDKQIMELTVIMQNRSDEMNRIEFDRRSQYRELSREHEQVIKQLSESESKYAKLLDEYEIIKKKLEDSLLNADAPTAEQSQEPME